MMCIIPGSAKKGIFNKNNRKNEGLKSQFTQKEDQKLYNQSGIYLRDDHCDWGSSGMNEFTNEFGIDN